MFKYEYTEQDTSLGSTIANISRNAYSEISKKFDSYFREVLDKHNISVQDWLRYGKIVCDNKLNICIYQGKTIFSYTDYDIVKNSDTSFTIKFYYSEDENIKML